MYSTRITNRTLSILCERVGVAFDVGQDPYRIFQREAATQKLGYANHMRSIAAHVERGGSLADAIRAQGNYFPENFVHLVEVGERTGRLERVLDRLATYYKDLADLRAEFFSSILWPMIQLALAIVVIGCMIYLPSVFAPDAGEQTDLLGIGLVGAAGLRTYSICVALGIGLCATLYFLGRNGHLGFVNEWLMHVPYLGKVLSVFDEANFVQSLALATESGMDAWTAVGLAFNGSTSKRFTSKAEAAKAAIRQGRELHVVLRESNVFSSETIEAVQLGEESGRLAETLDKHYRYMRLKVKSAMSTLTYLASAIIWALIAAVLITVIFRVFSRYLGGIEGAAESVINRGAKP
jgi:type II secretory pathway component PulF